ncbi:MAG TPA: FAD/NAD(P)-binding protein [Gemmatimonadota bacterium]|nr:FAD/NAD(P)-binding protein [Gemmatimonadota bacterium]
MSPPARRAPHPNGPPLAARPPTDRRIAIVGAGLSGRLVALNLLRRAPAGCGARIRLIDRGEPGAMGPAYSIDSEALLLNVPAGIMGASSDDEDGFRRWAAARRGGAGPGDFLPRWLYREYVFDLFDEAERDRTADLDFEEVRADVVDLELSGARATLRLADGRRTAADRVVLALGNFPPRHPPVRDRAVLGSERYVRNPWRPEVLDELAERKSLLFVGTGQTMIDLVLGLERRGHRGPMTAISRRGLLPMAHRDGESYPSFIAELEDPTSLRRLFGAVREHVARAAADGIDPRAVIDALRPHTQELWSGLPEAEKRRFMRHVFRYWERIRSRIPPRCEARLQPVLDSGRLRILAGRVRDVVDADDRIEVRYTPRRGSGEAVAAAELVVNCIGPEMDYGRVGDPLMRNLLRRGLVRPGPARLGMDARPNGAVVGADGEASGVLFTVGSPMKGLLWEVLAVPEIRKQAESLAALLLEGAESARE